MTLSFADIDKKGAPVFVPFRGIDFPLKYKRGTSDELVILFHGVIRRDVREFPAYEKFLPVSSHQIALTDPALLEDEEIISSWFLGKEGADQVAKLSDMI